MGERRKLSEEKKRERQPKDLTRNIPGGVHQCLNDPNLTLLDMSDSFLEMFGYTRAEIRTLFDNKFINMIYPGDRAEILRSLNEQLSRGTTIEAEYRVMSKSGTPVWILDKGKLQRDEDGTESFYCILIEITERKREQEQLRLTLERHRIIMDQATDIIFEWDIAADTLDFSPNWRKKFGYAPIDEQISRRIPLSENIHPEDMPAFVKIMHDTAAGVPYSEAEFRIRDAAGCYCWNRIRATAQFDDSGRSIKAVGVITDISEEKKERLALIELAQRDALTGLYNKAAIRERVEQCMSASEKSEKQALFIIDIDYFKQVNDTYGHLIGDKLLADIASVLKGQFRFTDLIGRIGGDEFLVYLPSARDEASIREKARALLRALAQVRPAPEAPPISCSIGAVVSPGGRKDYLGMYQCADRALYHQKNDGKNGVSFYSQEQCMDVSASGQTQSAVSDSIDSEQFSSVEEKLAQYSFQMLYRTVDVKAEIGRLMGIIGRAYGVSRVYIFESSKDGLRCSNTFEWCAPGISPQRMHLQNLRYKEDLGDYLHNFDEEGVFYCRDIRTLHPSLYAVLAPQEICSILQCAILDKGKFKGYMGFDECRENRSWSREQIKSLSLIARVLSVFLMKLRLEERLEEAK